MGLLRRQLASRQAQKLHSTYVDATVGSYGPVLREAQHIGTLLALHEDAWKRSLDAAGVTALSQYEPYVSIERTLLSSLLAHTQFTWADVADHEDRQQDQP